MADEQAQPEVVETPAPEVVDTPEVEAQSEETENVSEDVETPSEPSSRGKGDLQEALRQERELRQRYESSLQDPNFIYQQATRLGLTEEQAQDAAQQAAMPGLSVDQIRQQVRQEARFERSLEKSMEKYPELASNEEDQIAVTALTNKYGDPMKAAEKYYARFSKVKAEGKSEGVNTVRSEVTAKERAQTAPIVVNTDTDATNMADLRARMKSFDKKTQENAMVEWILLKNKK